jgi:hypothetical protein
MWLISLVPVVLNLQENVTRLFVSNMGQVQYKCVVSHVSPVYDFLIFVYACRKSL